MAQYNVQDPQGNNRVIEGPDGASDEEIISQAQQLFGHSGALPSSGLDKLKAYINSNHLGSQPQIDPQEQNVSSKPYEQQVLENLNTAGAGAAVGNLATKGALWAGGKAAEGIGSFLNTLKTSRGAPELAGLETPAEAGNAIETARTASIAQNEATAKKLYDAIPQDTQLPLAQTKSVADSVINEVKGLPKSFQSNKITALAGDLQNIDKASVGTIQSMNSTLKDIAYNGEGVEKLYAARLSKALQADLETFGKTSLRPAISEGPSLEAEALRKKWLYNAKASNNITDEVADQALGYVKPEMSQRIPGNLTNSDIPANLTKANSFYRDMKGLHNSPLAQALERASNEGKANVIFKAGRVDDINTGRALLGEEGFASAQRQFYQKLLKAPDIGKALGKYDSTFINEALTPNMRKALEAVDMMHKHAANMATVAKVAIPSAGLLGLYAKFKH